ncbi:MAG: hypothetical protein GF329_04475 [Candidatus Lokiarchaeota archaeon]|nr:hypothetical protein [Candidatus Lokiarchaeota archaeon]
MQFKNNRLYSLIIGVAFILFISLLFITPFLILNDLNQNKSYSPQLLYEEETVFPKGPGPILTVLEQSFGTKNDYNIENDTSITWNVPSGWIGSQFGVQISNLTTELDDLLHHISDNGDSNAMSENGTSHQDTHYLDGDFWQLIWFGTEMVAYLNYTTTAHPNSITNIDISLDFERNFGNGRKLDIAIYDFISGSWEILESLNTDGSYTRNYDENDLNNQESNYIDIDGSIDLQFVGQTPSSPSDIKLDYVYINITANREYVNPTDVNLEVNGNYIPDNGIIYLKDTYNPGSHNFLFDCGDSYFVSFNTYSGMWINRTITCTSTYFRGSSDLPDKTYWNISFNAESPPSGYSSKNFTIFCPGIWTFVNASAESGSKTISTGTYDNNLTLLITNSNFEEGSWGLFCSSNNIIDAIHVRKNSIEVKKSNITDTISISCDLIESGINGKFNLTIFNETDTIHQEFMNVSGSTVTFTDWTISDNTSFNGEYSISISWKNKTLIGYAKTTIIAIYPTKLNSYNILPEYFLTQSLNMTVYYNNTFTENGYNEMGISQANVTYAMMNSTNYMIENGNLTDLNNGNYTYLINLENYTVGNYTIEINASKRYYHNISVSFDIQIFGHNTSFNVSIPMINGVGSASCGYSNTTIFELKYYNYTDKVEDFISGAEISIYKNHNYSNPLSNKFWQETPQSYFIYLNSSDKEFVSNWVDINSNITITIKIKKGIFYPQTFDIKWDVKNSTAKLDGNLQENRFSGNFGLKVNYTNLFLNESITDYFSPSFELFYNGSKYNSLKTDNIFNGTWNLTCIFNETTNVSYSIDIKVSTLGFIDTSFSLTLNIDVIRTTYSSFNLTDPIHYYHNLSFYISYNRTYPIIDGLENAIISSNIGYSLYITNLNDGNYKIEVDTAYQLDLTNYTFYFLIKETHFQQINFSINFSMVNVNTNITIEHSTDPNFEDYNTSVFVNQSLGLNLKYYDEFKEIFIPDSSFDAYIGDINGTYIDSQYNITRYSNHISVQIDTFGLHMGNYTLKLNCNKLFYFQSNLTLSFTIKPYVTDVMIVRNNPDDGQIQVNNYIEWYMNDISFSGNYSGQFYNGFNSFIDRIDWGLANFIIFKENTDPNDPVNRVKNKTLVYEPVERLYQSLKIDLIYENGTYIKSGNYTVLISFFARDCINRTVNFSLEILPLLSGRIEVSQVSSVSVGQQFLLEMRLYVDEEPYSGQLRVNFIYKSNDGSIVKNETVIFITDSDGIVKRYYRVQEDYGQIIIDIVFERKIGYYPDESIKSITLDSPMTIEVTTVTNPLPIIIVLLIAVIGMASVILIVKIKIIDPRKTKQLEMSEEKFNQFKDLASISSIILIHKPKKKIFYKKFLADLELDQKYWNDLISKIGNFTGFEQKNNAALDLINYDSMKILIDDGEYIRTALLLNNYPTEIVLKSVVKFNQYFELINYDNLRNDQVDKIDDLNRHLDKRFGLSYIIPYIISYKKLGKTKFTSFEDTLINMARSLSENDFFYISDLYRKVINETLIEGMIIFQTIEKLLKAKIFIPYEAHLSKGEPTKKGLKHKTIDRPTQYRTQIVSLKNKAINAIKNGNYSQALESYKKAAELAKQNNLREEWKLYLNRIEEMKFRLDNIQTQKTSDETIRPGISHEYSVRMSTISQVKNKYDEKIAEENKKKAATEEKPSKPESKTKIKPKKVRTPSPTDIEEIKSIISPKKEAKSNYTKPKKKSITLEDQIKLLDDEIDEIDEKIRTKRKKYKEELTPFERALKFGVDLKDNDIFEDKSELKEKTQEIIIEDKRIIKINEESDEKTEISMDELIKRCPECHSKITEKTLKLVFKGYEPECDNCGFKFNYLTLIQKSKLEEIKQLEEERKARSLIKEQMKALVDKSKKVKKEQPIKSKEIKEKEKTEKDEKNGVDAKSLLGE